MRELNFSDPVIPKIVDKTFDEVIFVHAMAGKLPLRKAWYLLMEGLEITARTIVLPGDYQVHHTNYELLPWLIWD